MIIDTHCHLNDDRYNDDFADMLARASEAGVRGYIIPGADPRELEKACKIAHEFDDVYFAAGVHPYDIEYFDLDYLVKFMSDSKCIAVGECGLDYFRFPKDEAAKQSEKSEQKRVFIAQIELAIKFNKPLIVHSREANEDTYQILAQYADDLKSAVLHCYNSSPRLLELANLGHFYYGIGGVLTFKNAKSLVEILPQIPKDRLLIETDAPYLTPEPFRGQRNEPSYTDLVAKKIGELLNLSKDEVCEITTANAYRAFDGLKGEA
ncbi:TatD family hydrolase [Campylobacter sp. 19-13652]|uniref:TatD family hydrolase n=1 Tax=Campylobacter sp. 19-13652 TaxID=2840180 RepID=UPI001C76D345|nr:TatD family hydrolase [Campylobacter sp. 19-13652]BCX79065.1 TatD-related deoxyribonuclease [Campylobacter sp. 19-13652]